MLSEWINVTITFRVSGLFLHLYALLYEVLVSPLFTCIFVKKLWIQAYSL